MLEPAALPMPSPLPLVESGGHIIAESDGHDAERAVDAPLRAMTDGTAHRQIFNVAANAARAHHSPRLAHHSLRGAECDGQLLAATALELRVNATLSTAVALVLARSLCASLLLDSRSRSRFLPPPPVAVALSQCGALRVRGAGDAAMGGNGAGQESAYLRAHADAHAERVTAGLAIGLEPGVLCAHLRFHDGSVVVLHPRTSRFIIGSSSLPLLSRLSRHNSWLFSPRHLSFSFHDDILAVCSSAPSAGSPAGPFILRAGGRCEPITSVAVALGAADTAYFGCWSGSAPENATGPITFRFLHISDIATPPPADDSLAGRLALAERALRVSEVERDRLQGEVDSLTRALTSSDDALHTALSRTVDALERRRVREDGILCACCAMLRLPHYFFPSILAAGTPPTSRRCAFCIQHVRTYHDLFGRPFYTPPGYTLPQPHPADLARLAELERCVSCARMRHGSLFGMSNMLGATGFVCLAARPARISTSVPRSAQRSPTHRPICVFCRRELALSQSPTPPAAGARLLLDARATTQWEPDPDAPADAEAEDFGADPSDPPDDAFVFDGMLGSLP